MMGAAATKGAIVRMFEFALGRSAGVDCDSNLAIASSITVRDI